MELRYVENVIKICIGVDRILLILFDSLRLDFSEQFKGIFKDESWSKYRTHETFTAPVLATVATGKTPEELGISRDFSAFWSSIDKTKIDDTLFDHFDSHVTISRLMGDGPMQVPPARRKKFKFMPPIDWNAVSNWDPDIFNYVGRKYSLATDDWWDLIFWHSFSTHGPYSIFSGLGPAECPEVVNTDRLMRRLSKKERFDWYQMGINHSLAALRGINDICDNQETIICFADHGEALGEELDGKEIFGHVAGMQKLDELGMVPIWINRDEKIPDNISHLTLKDWVVDMYKKYEVEDESYQEMKAIKECREM